jgi:MFS transporter, ACS family, tartrate transporter
LIFGASATNPVIAFSALVICAFGLGDALGVFWLVPMRFLSGAAAAGGFAVINMIGNSAGFFSPYIIGWIRQTTGSFVVGLYALGVCMLVSALLVFIQWKVGEKPAASGAI